MKKTTLFSKIVKILLIVLGVLALAFVGLVIYEVTIGLPEPSSEALPPTPPEEIKEPAPCLFTREPEETWPDQTASDPPIGNVELIKSFRLKTYDVFGSDLYEVHKSMQEKGPVITNSIGIGFANSTISVTRSFLKNTSAGCTLTGVKVFIDMSIILPKWADKASASDQDQKMVDIFLKFAKRHEQGHINIGLKAAREIQAELAQLRSAPTCQELNTEVKKLYNDIVPKAIEADDEYDNRTNHGTTQRPSDYPFTCNWREIEI